MVSKGVSELVGKSYEEIQEKAETGEAITGIATGFSKFDNETAGLQKET